jgi:hypothetical protein
MNLKNNYAELAGVSQGNCVCGYVSFPADLPTHQVPSGRIQAPSSILPCPLRLP